MENSTPCKYKTVKDRGHTD